MRVFFIIVCVVTIGWFLITTNTEGNRIPKQAELAQSLDGVELYFLANNLYVLTDGSIETRERGLVVDQGKVIATLAIPDDRYLRLVRVNDESINIIIHRGTQFIGGLMYSISRADGAIAAWQTNGAYWATTPDERYFITANQDSARSEPILFLLFNSYEGSEADFSIALSSEFDTKSGIYVVNDLQYSPDGLRLAVVVDDTIANELEPEKRHGIIFGVDPITQTSVALASFSIVTESDPSSFVPFLDSIAGWEGDSAVLLKLPDGQELRVDVQ